MVGALLVALVDLGRVSQVTLLGGINWVLIVYPSSHFSEHLTLTFFSHSGLARLVACPRFFNFLITNLNGPWIPVFSISDPRLL